MHNNSTRESWNLKKSKSSSAPPHISAHGNCSDFTNRKKQAASSHVGLAHLAVWAFQQALCDWWERLSATNRARNRDDHWRWPESLFETQTPFLLQNFWIRREISDVCEISDLLLFVGYFVSQSKQIKFDDGFFDVCCVNYNFLVGCQIRHYHKLDGQLHSLHCYGHV